ncbi:MAG: hypothetical protein LBE04_01190, partial [Prevotellaceae bacterium]|nr:hypothetical protein [Prevotellaceae bacterium]
MTTKLFNRLPCGKLNFRDVVLNGFEIINYKRIKYTLRNAILIAVFLFGAGITLYAKDDIYAKLTGEL